MAFGLGKNKKGTIILITIGTGLGSSYLLMGNWFPIRSLVISIIKKRILNIMHPTLHEKKGG
jgi:hypothetical protein